jgi:Predicted hydrolases or acyltransferases (alpha/beta hydrolase superfamily)
MFPARRPELRTRYLDLASGIRVRAVESGEPGAPMIVLVPGWGCSVYVFRDNLATLAAAGFHAVAVDLKGHGLSDKPLSTGHYRLDAMRLHVVEILDALSAQSVVLAGLSMGASLAAHVAATLPGRVRGVVMGSPVGFDGVPGLRMLRGATPSPVVPLLPRIVTRAGISSILRFVTGKLRPITKRDVDEYWAPTQFPEFTIAMRRLVHEYDWNSPLRALEVPSLLLTGTHDPLLSRSRARRLARGTPGLSHVEIRNAGHVVYDEAPVAVNEAIIAFVRTLGQSAVPYIPTDNDKIQEAGEADC